MLDIFCSLDYSVLIHDLYIVVDDAEKFKLLCKILHSEQKLLKNMLSVYCILKCEADIIQQADYDVIYPVLKEQGFFTHYEEKILHKEDNVEGIVDILKNKEMNYFDEFLDCLKQHSPSVFAKINDMITKPNVNENTTINIIPNYNCNSFMVQSTTSLLSFRSYLTERYTGRSFKDTSAGLDNKHTFVFPTLIEFDEEVSINHKNIFYEQESCMTIFSCSEIFEKGHRVVLLQGSPGSGKTTIAYKMCKEWAEGKLDIFSHVIVMHLEDDRVARCKNIEEFIELLVGVEEGNMVASDIRKIHGQGVLLILEGWDHLLPEQRRHSLFTDLVKGQLFPKATIVITGRPSACVTLPYQFINCKIQIFGFNQRQVSEYINCSCKNHPDEAQVMQSQLTHFQCCRIICIPVNLCIILTILKQTAIKSSCTVTELYKQFLLYLLNRHKEDVYSDNRKIKHFASLGTDLPHKMYKILQNLAKMAYYNLMKNNVAFDEQEIRKYCFESEKVPRHFDGMGLLQVVNSICLYVERNFHFSHQNIQELLAAWYLSQQTIPFQQQYHQLLDDKEMFCLFYKDFVRDAVRCQSSLNSSKCTIC